MARIVFKDLEKSDLVRQNVKERLEPITERFPDVKSKHLVVTLSMENSPTQPGPDLFGVKVQFEQGTYKGLILEKTAQNLYSALAQVMDSIHERLIRHDEKVRSQRRQKRRKAKQEVLLAQ